MRKILFCAVFLALLLQGHQAQAQLLRLPDCQFTGQITATGRIGGAPDSKTAGFDNRLKGCTTWTLTVTVTGFSGTSITQDDAQDSSGAAGSWASWQGTIQVGALPITSTTSYRLVTQGFYPWVSVNVASLTGSGTVTLNAYGWRDMSAGNPAIGVDVIGVVGATKTLDVTLGALHTLTSTASTNMTITPSAAGTAGQPIEIVITGDATGGDVVTFASPFKPNGTMILTASKGHTIWFRSDGSFLWEMSRVTGL